MNRILLFILFVIPFTLLAQNDKSRLIVLADMGNEPDEEQQMIHMLMSSNEFDVEGLIAVTGKYLTKFIRPDIFHDLIDEYALVYDNLKLHDPNYPSPAYLHGVTLPGQIRYGMSIVGEGMSSPGSNLIIKQLMKDDARPILIVVNAGSNTLAQALVDFKKNHTEEELKAFVSKIRVFENGAQDNAGAWICHNFPDIQWIRSNFQTYAFGGNKSPWVTADTDYVGPHTWKPYSYSPRGQHQWALEHIITEHGHLGLRYPLRRIPDRGRMAYLEGGGTIPWLGLVSKGLTHLDHPNWGGWWGRFTDEKVKNYWSRHADVKRDETENTPFYVYGEATDKWTDPDNGVTYDTLYSPIWRWRQAMFNDLKCRMDWCVKPYEEANHHPIAAFDEDSSNQIVYMEINAGSTIDLDASKTKDPDGDGIIYSWYNYAEVSTYKGNLQIENSNRSIAKLKIPKDAGDTQIHIILEIKDDNKIGSLYDYRRIVIDVK